MFEKNLIKFDKIDSTNTYLKTHASELNSGTIVDAKIQTSGYGRKNRTWYDDGINNLSFSLLLKIEVRQDFPILTQAVAAAIAITLKTIGIESKIKWPNDILINCKKVAGILLETIISEKNADVIIGIGLNVNSTIFDKDIDGKATSLFLESKQKYDLDYLRDLIVDNIYNFVDDYIKGDYDFLDICRSYSYLIGKNVYLDDNIKKEALVKGIDQLGRLVVLIDNKEEKFNGSEVSLKGVYSQGEK